MVKDMYIHELPYKQKLHLHFMNARLEEDVHVQGSPAPGMVFAAPNDRNAEPFPGGAVIIRYLDPQIRRVCIWKGAEALWLKARQCYGISCETESVPENRRDSKRVPLNWLAPSRISMLNGEYACLVDDISLTGIGMSVDAGLVNKGLKHRTFITRLGSPGHGDITDVESECIRVQPEGCCARLGLKITRSGPGFEELVHSLS